MYGNDNNAKENKMHAFKDKKKSGKKYIRKTMQLNRYDCEYVFMCVYV